jgi:Cdc6-like AAA superfamily ATPase
VYEISSVTTKLNATAVTIEADVKLQRIHSWLSPSDPSTNHNKALNQRHEGTGQWFVKGEAFTSFKEGKVPFLWLNGIPGCGKTVLSSSIIEGLQQTLTDTSPITLYFYFDFNDNRKQTLKSAIRSLLWQMTKYSGSYLKELEQLYGVCKDGRDQASEQALIQTLDKALRGANCVRIVLDALDECTNRPVLLPWLAQLARHETGNVQVVAISRKEHDIEVGFEKWLEEGATIPLRQLDVDVDIKAYVYARLREDSQLQRWQGKPKVQDEIEAKLMTKANGM